MFLTNIKNVKSKGINMSNYLKKIFFAVLILMVPYMNSVSKAMDTEDYEGGSIVRARAISFVTEDRQDVPSFTQQSTVSKDEGLEYSKNSWTSYLISPVNITLKMANEFISLAHNNPKLAIMTGILYIVPKISAGMCYCYYPKPPNCLGPVEMSSSAACSSFCWSYERSLMCKYID